MTAYLFYPSAVASNFLLSMALCKKMKAIFTNEMPDLPVFNQRVALAMQNGICKLCLRPAKLKKSHIIPEFNYSAMYDDRHRIEGVSKQRRIYLQKGVYEHMLCGDCEQKFSCWEKYYKHIVYDDGLELEEQGSNYLILKGIDSPQAYLHHLSLIWRMAMSTLPMFRMVDLGEKHSERIRQLLLTENGNDFLEYPVGITALRLLGKFEPGWIYPPDFVHDSKRRRVYRFVIAGFLYQVYVSSQPLDSDPALLEEQRGRIFVNIANAMDIPFIAKNLKELHLALKHHEAKKKKR